MWVRAAAVGTCFSHRLAVLTAYVAGPGGKTQLPRGLLGHRPPALQVAKVASADLPPQEHSAVATLSASSLQQARPGYGKCPVLWSGNADCTQVTAPLHPSGPPALRRSASPQFDDVRATSTSPSYSPSSSRTVHLRPSVRSASGTRSHCGCGTAASAAAQVVPTTYDGVCSLTVAPAPMRTRRATNPTSIADSPLIRAPPLCCAHVRRRRMCTKHSHWPPPARI